MRAMPSFFSRTFILWLTADWVRELAAAARVKLLCLMMSQKIFSVSMSTVPSQGCYSKSGAISYRQRFLPQVCSFPTTQFPVVQFTLGDFPKFRREGTFFRAVVLLRSEEHTSELQSQSNLVC